MKKQKNLVNNEKPNRILERLKEIRPPIITLTGGEPLVHPLFERIVKELSETSKIALSTTGFGIEKHYRLLKSIGVEVIQLSVHPDISFNYPCDIVERIKISKDVSREVQINYVLTQRNKDRIFELLSHPELKDLTLRILLPLSEKKKYWSIEEFLEESFAIIRKIPKGKNIKIAFSNMIGAFILKFKNVSPPYCNALTKTLRIDPFGNVFMCNFLKKETSLGTIFDEEKSILQKRNQIIKEVWKLNDRCTKCPYKDKCKGGCRALRKYYGDDLCVLDILSYF